MRSYWTRVGSCPVTGVLVRRGTSGQGTQMEEDHVKGRDAQEEGCAEVVAEMGGGQPRARTHWGCQEPPGARGGEEGFALRAFGGKGCVALTPLDLGLPASRTMGKDIPVVFSRPAGGTW